MALVGLVYNTTKENDREHWRRILAEMGLNLVAGSFEEGATVNTITDAVWYMAEAQCYTWGSVETKTIPSRSTPASTGGVGVGKWLNVEGSTAHTLVSFEGVKHLYVGVFSAGVNVRTPTDVVSDPTTGWYYVYTGALPHTVGPSETLDSNWKPLGNINGYAYNHFLNWKNNLVTDEQAMTAAFNTGMEVDIEGAAITTTTEYTTPYGAKGMYGRGTITLGGHFRVTTSTYPTMVTFTTSASCGHSEIYLDGIDHTGQYLIIDNGYPFCIDVAENPATPADSIDGKALTRNLNGYQSQFIQVTEVIGHTADNKAVLAQPLVVNQVAGTAKFGFPTGNLTSFKIRDGVTMRSSGKVLRRLMLLAQMRPEVTNCTFHNVHVEMRYYCYAGKFEGNKLTGNVPSSMFSFATSSSVCSIKDNNCSTLGLDDATIGVYRQVCYVNCVGNIVTDPLISTAYAHGHWGITFHSMVYNSVIASNTVTSRSGICAQFFCDNVLIEGNTINAFLLNFVYNNGVTFENNDINIISDSLIVGNQRFTSSGNRWNMRAGFTTNCVAITTGGKPFSFAGFKTINSVYHDFNGDTFSTIGKAAFLNPKTLMANPTTAPVNAVFPTNNAHMNGQTSGISIYDSRVGVLRVNGCRFQDLNYGINVYKDDTSKGSTLLELSNNTFATDVGICLRGIAGQSLVSGFIKNCSFTGLYGVINANTLGIPVLDCNFLTPTMSAILVASNLESFMGVTMNTNCSMVGAVQTGFKWYDFNGYSASYASVPTYSLASSLPGGYWWYAPAENLGQSASIPYEYSKGTTPGGGVLLRKALTVTQVV